MWYIAVFNLFSIPVAKGFDSLKEAIDYLDQRQADPDSLPLGIFDVAAAGIISCQPEDYCMEEQDKTLIMTIAQSYLKQAA